MDRFVVGLCLALLAGCITYWEWRKDRPWRAAQRHGIIWTRANLTRFRQLLPHEDENPASSHRRF